MTTTPLDANPFGPGQPCFGCAQDHPIGFRLRFAKESADPSDPTSQAAVTTRFLPGERYQGPPGILHGGLVSTLADEIGAWTVLGLLGKFGFTAQMSMKLARPVRVGTWVEGRGVITRETPRIVEVAVTLVQAGETALRGDFTFVLLDEAGAERLLGTPIPDAWKSFCR
ncbi:MAG: PaaI family thioesterase [Polyangiaceae bacterium]